MKGRFFSKYLGFSPANKTDRRHNIILIIIETIYNCLIDINDRKDSVFVSTAVDRGFEVRSSDSKIYKCGICCFIAKHATLTNTNKD